MDVSNKLPERLRLLRQEKKLTQAEMAREILVPRVTYTHYELGKRTPDLDIIILLARFHQVSVDFLVGNTLLRPTLEHWLRISGRTAVTVPHADASDSEYDIRTMPPLGKVADHPAEDPARRKDPDH